ncbi:hypothetical protein Tco_1516168 [Tanacetum coccineum]
MFDKLLNETTIVVSKSSAVTTADAPNQHQQQHTTPSTSTTIAADTPLLNIQTTPESTSQAPTVTLSHPINFSTPCLPECKIVGQILLDHPLSYALTTTGDVPAVYLQQFWKTVSKVSNTKDTIRYKLDTQEIMYTIDMFCNTLKLPVETLKNPFIVPVNIWIIESFFNRVGYQGVVDKVSTLYTKFLAQPWQTMFKKKDYIQYPRFTKLIIVDLIKKYSSISSILREDYHSIKDDISLIRAIDDYKEYETVFVNIVVLMNQPQQVISTQGTHRSTPKAHRIPTLTFASPQGKKTKQSDDKDRDGMAETTLLSLTLHKTALAAEAKENIAKVQEKLDEEEIERMVEGDDDDESNSKVVEDDDDVSVIKKKDDEKKDDNTEKVDDAEEKDDDDQTDHALVEPQVEGSRKTRNKQMQTSIPTPNRSHRKDLSLYKIILEELTTTISPTTATTSKQTSKSKFKRGFTSYKTKILPGSIAGMSMRRG